MEILEAFDLVGTPRGAAEPAGRDHKTVAHHVAAREDAGGDRRRQARTCPRSGPHAEKIAEWVERSHGRAGVREMSVETPKAPPLPDGIEKTLIWAQIIAIAAKLHPTAGATESWGRRRSARRSANCMSTCSARRRRVEGRDCASGKAEGSWPAENGSAMTVAG